jgi:RHS repeat-associated protein
MQSNIGIDVTRYKFTGQEWDAETGLYYYNARYYDPKLARFTSADTIVPEPLNPQALNRYSYCINNPINLIDPSGHGFLKWLSDLWEDIKHIGREIVGAVEFVVGAVLSLFGPTNPLGYIGVAMMIQGAYLMGANVNASVSTDMVSFGGGGPGSSSWIEYIGPGSGYDYGYGGSGGGGSGGYGNGYNAGGNSSIGMTFYAHYSNYTNNIQTTRDSINSEMYPYQSRRDASKESNTLKGPESAAMRIAKGTAFAVMATGVVTWEVARIVGNDVLMDILPGKAIHFMGNYIKPLEREGIALAVDMGIGIAITTHEAHQEYAGDFRALGERVGDRIRKLRDWWYGQ